MSNLKSHYQSILKELENHLQNEEDKKFVVNKFHELALMFMDVIDRVTYLTDERIKEIEEKQQVIGNKVDMVAKAVDGIQNDIYEDDETYEFEIICPYCNNEFVADINSDVNSDIECPECHNIIELDWNEDECCDGQCSHCNGCEDEHDDFTYGDECEDECNCSGNCSCEEDEEEDDDM